MCFHSSFWKKVPWLKITITVIVVVLLIFNGVMLLIDSKTQPWEPGEITANFKEGAKLHEINETLEKYGYSIISYDYYRNPESNQTNYFVIVKVPKGEEKEAVRNLEKEEIVSSVYIEVYSG